MAEPHLRHEGPGRRPDGRAESDTVAHRAAARAGDAHDSHDHHGHDHGHGHHHGLGHHHHHVPASFNRAFAIGVTLNVCFVVVEAVYGFLADSLALLADAGHNLSDVLTLLLAWGAAALASRRPTARRTYGYRRGTILASLISSFLLLVATAGIAWEALGRFAEPTRVDGWTMIVVAGIGVVVNGVTAWLFAGGREHDLNIRAAFLHMAADAAVSLGVVIGGVAVLLAGWYWTDPVLSLLIVGVILWGTWDVLRESLNLAFDAVPRAVDPVAVRDYLAGLPGVDEVHDLHIWGMSTTETALTAHLVMPAGSSDRFLGEVSDDLQQRFRIAHTTLQIERGDAPIPCPQDC